MGISFNSGPIKSLFGVLMAVVDQWNEAQVRQKLMPFAASQGGLLPALRTLQSCFGCIDERAVALLAEIFNLSQSEVHGVVSFYHEFRSQPAGRHTVRVCQAEACQAVGSRALTEQAKSLLGIDFHETTADGLFTLEPVYCLGNCACSPAIMVDESTYGRITAANLELTLKTHAEAGDS
jgi:formate dehydrogenase subunit gamma